MAGKVTNKKSLTLTNINKSKKILDEQLEVKVYSSTTDEYFDLTVDKHLKKTKIMNLVSEMMAQLQYARQNEINIADVTLPYSILLLMKHFTSLGKEIPSDLPSQIALMNKLIDLDLMQPILEIFPQEGVSELFDTIAKTIEDTNNQVKNIESRIVEIERAYEEGNLDKILGIEEDEYIVYNEVEGDSDSKDDE